MLVENNICGTKPENNIKIIGNNRFKKENLKKKEILEKLESKLLNPNFYLLNLNLIQ